MSTPKGVRAINENVVQNGRAFIITDMEDIEWNQIPDGSLFINPVDGIMQVKLTGETTWIPASLKNDGTLVIARDTSIEIESFTVTSLDNEDGTFTYQNTEGEQRYKEKTEQGYVFELDKGTYIPNRNHLFVTLNGKTEYIAKTGGIEELDNTRFRFPSALHVGDRLTVKYVKWVKIGNPYPRIFITDNEPITAEVGDLWLEPEGTISNSDSQNAIDVICPIVRFKSTNGWVLLYGSIIQEILDEIQNIYIVIDATKESILNIMETEFSRRISIFDAYTSPLINGRSTMNGGSGQMFYWYRAYEDGWVEQGGHYEAPENNTDYFQIITLPIAMKDSNYTIVATKKYPGSVVAFNSSRDINISNIQTTSFCYTTKDDSWYAYYPIDWRATGFYDKTIGLNIQDEIQIDIRKYTFTLKGTTNQTITFKYKNINAVGSGFEDERTSTSLTIDQTFALREGTTWTASITPDIGFNAGTLSGTSGTISKAVTLSATAATLKTFTLTLSGTSNQTVTLKYKKKKADGSFESEVSVTSTGSAQNITLTYGSTWTASVSPNTGFNAGTLSPGTSGTVTADTTVSVTAAALKTFTLTLAGTSNQTITLKYKNRNATDTGFETEVTKTSTGSEQSFTVRKGTTWTATIAASSGYNAGTLSPGSSGTVTAATTVSASAAVTNKVTITIKCVNTRDLTGAVTTIYTNVSGTSATMYGAGTIEIKKGTKVTIKEKMRARYGYGYWYDEDGSRLYCFDLYNASNTLLATIYDEDVIPSNYYGNYTVQYTTGALNSDTTYTAKDGRP